MSEQKRPKSIQEMVDILRAWQTERAILLARSDDPTTTIHPIEVGKWRGRDEILNQIEEWIKPPKESKD